MTSYTVVNHRIVHTKTGLISLANQYFPVSKPKDSNSALTLVFAHGTSNHKEQWEAIIDNLFQNGNPLDLEQAWALDWQNHGQSALVNKAQLQARDPIGIEEYGDLLREFVESPDLRSKRIIAFGHSGSTAAWTIAAFESTLAVSPIKSYILFEPVHIHPPMLPNDSRIQKGATNVQGVKARKTTFDSYEEAEKRVRTKYPWKIWDKRVQDAYLKYGLWVDQETGQTSTCCTTTQEVWNYEPYVYILAGHLYPKFCAAFDVHLVFGERLEMHSPESRKKFSDGLEGRSPSSVHTIPKSGHLVVQEKPGKCADMIREILAARRPIPKSHL